MLSVEPSAMDAATEAAAKDAGMVRVFAIMVLLEAAGCFPTDAHSQPPGATSADELARLSRRDPKLPDTSFQGMHSDFYADPLGRFMDLLGAGGSSSVSTASAV